MLVCLSPQYGPSLGCGWRDGLQEFKVTANILNKQPRTNDKGCLLLGGWAWNKQQLTVKVSL
jgi:hypothetical protein